MEGLGVIMPKRKPVKMKVDPDFATYMKHFKIDKQCKSIHEATKVLLEDLRTEKKRRVRMRL